LDLHSLTGIVATILTPFCVIVPFWLICVFARFTALLEIWPAILVAGVAFATTQLLVARLHGTWLVDISAAVVTIAALLTLLRFWQPRRILNADCEDITGLPQADCRPERAVVLSAMVPWAILTAGVILWGLPSFGHWLDSFSTFKIHIAGLDNVVVRVPPAVPQPAAETAGLPLNLFFSPG